MVKDLGNRFTVDAEISDGSDVAQVTADGRLQVSGLVTDGTRTAAITETSAQLVSGLKSRFRDAFTSFNSSAWTLTKDANDLVTIDGNAGGASYLKITKGTVANTETSLLSVASYAVPCRFFSGVSLSRRLVGQEFAVELVQVDGSGNVLADSYTPLALSALPVCLTGQTGILTFTTATAHGLLVGDRVVIYGHQTSSLNVGPVYVTNTLTFTTFTVAAASAVASTTYGAVISGYVVKLDALKGATSAMGVNLSSSTTAANADAVIRTGESMPLTTAWNPGAALTTPVVATTPVSFNAAYTYAATPGAMVEMIASNDHVAWCMSAADSSVAAASATKRDQTVLDSTKLCKIRIRALNTPNYFSVVGGRILKAEKSGGVTATFTFASPHGLVATDVITILGVRDQTYFPNPVATQVGSIVSPTQITANIGTSTTISSFGGVVVRVNASLATQIFPTIPAAVAVQSILRLATASSAVPNRLQLTFLSSPGAWVVGESVNVVGLVAADFVTSYPQYEGLYRVANYYTVSPFTVELDPLAGQDLTPLSTVTPLVVGGTFITATDMRVHYTALFDYTSQIVEAYAGKAKNDALNALPVNVQAGTVIVSSIPSIAGTVQVSSTNATVAATPGTLFTTNIPQGTNNIVPAVDFLSTTNYRSKYFATLTTDRQCDLVLEHASDATGLLFDIASPRIAATRYPGDVMVISALSRTTTVSTVTTSFPHSFKVGQFVVIQGSSATTLSFNGTWFIATVPSATTFTYTQGSATETATSIVGATVTGSAKFYAQVSAPAIFRQARARIYNTSVLPTSTIIANIGAVRTLATIVTLTTVANHGLSAGDVVVVSGMSDATNFLTSTYVMVLSTPMPTVCTVYWPGTNATSGGGTIAPLNNTTYVNATVAATI